MKMQTYIAVTIRILPMIAAAVTLAATVDGALAMAGGKRVGSNYSSAHSLTGEIAGRVNNGLVEKPIGKPLPPIDAGRGDGRMGGKPGSDHKYGGWHEGRRRDHNHRHKHSRYESPPLIERGVVPPVLTGR